VAVDLTFGVIVAPLPWGFLPGSTTIAGPLEPTLLAKRNGQQ
jgi:hypothetical protein